MPVVDLFSGPGGLAEGFSAFRSPTGRRRFRVALSIENDRDAHRTLRLRAFLRNFSTDFPSEYYDFLNGKVTEEPDWETLYPARWAAACDETRCLELGTSGANTFLRERIGTIREEFGGRTVLLGGPPCQSYSVIGRSRNLGNRRYDARLDKRLLLYKQYARVLARLRPAVAVMENVKGILSAHRNGRTIFPQVIHSLRHAGGADSYRLFALGAPSRVSPWDEGLSPNDFLVHAEHHGVPQSRHRVFIICVRSDLAASLPDECLPRLESGDRIVSVNDVIGVMPKLRSRLSRGDNPGAWQDAVREACDLVEEHQLNTNPSARVDLGSRSKDRLPSICATRTRATDTGREPFVRYHRLRLTDTTRRDCSSFSEPTATTSQRPGGSKTADMRSLTCVRFLSIRVPFVFMHAALRPSPHYPRPIQLALKKAQLAEALSCPV